MDKKITYFVVVQSPIGKIHGDVYENCEGAQVVESALLIKTTIPDSNREHIHIYAPGTWTSVDMIEEE